ncbi:hypothetical protein AX16_004800 [Volvariella volvacea WC 439]|nr:hypothetical protein AX16_004800 [Volvariella volvacea WC 439]
MTSLDSRLSTLSNKLPTLDSLNATIPPNLDAKKVAQDWLSSFASNAESGNVEALAASFIEDAWWRDFLALTWNFRTFHPLPTIKQFLADRLPISKVSNFKIRDRYTGLQQPYPDIAWVQLIFDFETEFGIGFGLARLVPTPNGEWKAYVVFTNLEGLKGFPEKIGHLRNPAPNHGQWEKDRLAEAEFLDRDPTVLIIGGGHSGLGVAARLKALGISALIVEKNEQIGDNWGNRYEALCLHDPVWYDHMPYLPFPPTWPVYTPALKLAKWLRHYAEAMELNVWLSSTVTKATQDPNTQAWHVTVKRAGGSERVLVVKHLIFATGVGGGVSNFPKYPGMDKFKGEILHSLQHKRALDHAGRKVVVVGSCTAAHDIAEDYYRHGVDVTMLQRGPTYIMSMKNGWDVLFRGIYSEGSPPTDIADRLSASLPYFMSIGLAQRRVKKIAELDKDLLESLKKVGFRIDFGYQGTGFGLLALNRAGGYYHDTGASTLIAEGKIKLKNDSQLSEFTENGIRFENGSELAADVVLFATGLGDARETIRSICGDTVADQCDPIWGLNEEGELNGCWRDIGFKGLWYMVGNLALSRFHSSHLALQIKAMEEGVFGTRYRA